MRRVAFIVVLYPLCIDRRRILLFTGAWAFSAYDYNFYFDQTHYVDRLLLIAFAMLVLVHPGFVLPFLLEAIAIAYQFHHPLGGTWSLVQLYRSA